MQDARARYDEISAAVVDAAMNLHRRWGPGLLESAYQQLLVHELGKRGFRLRTEVPVPLAWDGLVLDTAFRADIIVDDLVLIELKAVEQNAPVHKRQVLTYLKLTNLRLGLLINFGVEHLRDGISRVANGMPT